MRTAVMTDTNSGISVPEGKELGIFVLPMPVIIDGKDYREGKDVAFRDVFRAMEAGKHVSTSSPLLGELKVLWDSIFEEGYEEIVYIPMSSGLSSSCAQAGSLAEHYNGRVFVVDNHRISLTQYESVLDAKAFPGYTFLYHPLSCSVACHTGPGALGTGFVVMERYM